MKHELNRALFEETQRQLREARELLAEQVDDEPCDYDHHGYCQAHSGGFRMLDDYTPECWHKAVREFLGMRE